MLLEIPAHFLGRVDDFQTLIHGEWTSMSWGHRQHDFKVVRGLFGWVNYLTKECSFNGDVIDLENTFL
jgi:hypothetical protein